MILKHVLEEKARRTVENQSKVCISKDEAVAILRLIARTSDRRRSDMYIPVEDQVLLIAMVQENSWAGDLLEVPIEDRDEGWHIQFGDGDNFDFDGGRLRRLTLGRGLI